MQKNGYELIYLDTPLAVHEFELYHDPGRGSLHIDIDQAGLHAAFSDNGLHLTGDVIEAVVGMGGYLDGLLHIHYRFMGN